MQNTSLDARIVSYPSRLKNITNEKDLVKIGCGYAKIGLSEERRWIMSTLLKVKNKEL